MQSAAAIRENIRQHNLQKHRDWARSYRNRHREQLHARQRRLREKQKGLVQKLLGSECLICGSEEKIKYHEISGKAHQVTWSYILKHLQDFAPLCWDCHGFLHRKYGIVNWDRLKDLAARLKGSVEQLTIKQSQSP